MLNLFNLISPHFMTISHTCTSFLRADLAIATSTLQSGIDVPPDYLFFQKMHTRTFLVHPPRLLILSQEEIFSTRPRIVRRK